WVIGQWVSGLMLRTDLPRIGLRAAQGDLNSMPWLTARKRPPPSVLAATLVRVRPGHPSADEHGRQDPQKAREQEVEEVDPPWRGGKGQRGDRRCKQGIDEHQNDDQDGADETSEPGRHHILLISRRAFWPRRHAAKRRGLFCMGR